MPDKQEIPIWITDRLYEGDDTNHLCLCLEVVKHSDHLAAISTLAHQLSQEKNWKAQQLAVESEWNPQEVGAELGIKWGASIRANILPAIKELRAENARLTEALRVKEAECERLGKAAQTLVDTMETCHICKGTVLVEENPVHCEDCPFDCDNHDEPECASLYDLHLAVKQALAARRTQEREEAV